MSPSAMQKSIAAMFRIPQEQAHTISVKKYSEYMKWYWTDEARAERVADQILMRQMLINQKEYMNFGVRG